jgi:hypothetical protein
MNITFFNPGPRALREIQFDRLIEVNKSKRDWVTFRLMSGCGLRAGGVDSISSGAIDVKQRAINPGLNAG